MNELTVMHSTPNSRATTSLMFGGRATTITRRALRTLRDGTAGIFADAYGLGFWAEVAVPANWGRLQAMTTRKEPTDQCSVGGLRIDESRADHYLGGRRTTVTAARIDHICITSRAAYGATTGVWPADHDLSQAPWRIQQMSRHWGVGRRNIPAAAQAENRRSKRRAPLPPVLAAYMTARKDSPPRGSREIAMTVSSGK